MFGVLLFIHCVIAWGWDKNCYKCTHVRTHHKHWQNREGKRVVLWVKQKDKKGRNRISRELRMVAAPPLTIALQSYQTNPPMGLHTNSRRRTMCYVCNVIRLFLWMTVAREGNENQTNWFDIIIIIVLFYADNIYSFVEAFGTSVQHGQSTTYTFAIWLTSVGREQYGFISIMHFMF